MNNVTTHSDPHDVCGGVCVLSCQTLTCHTGSLLWTSSPWRIFILSSTKRRARLASDEICGETEHHCRCFETEPPSLRVASAFPIPVAAWRDVNDPGPRRAAVPGQTVHQGEWQMPGQKARFHFADLGWTSAHCSFNTKTCNTLNNKSGDLKLFPEQIYSSDYFTYIQLF